MRTFGHRRRAVVAPHIEPHTVVVLSEYLPTSRSERRALRMDDPETLWRLTSIWMLTGAERNAKETSRSEGANVVRR